VHFAFVFEFILFGFIVEEMTGEKFFIDLFGKVSKKTPNCPQRTQRYEHPPHQCPVGRGRPFWIVSHHPL
jgi:hypothetical protein